MKQKQYATHLPWEEYDRNLRYALWERYRNCQAYLYFDADDNLWIKSYNTVVAVISKTGGLSIRGYYSRTTSAQITKIYRSYKAGNIHK